MFHLTEHLNSACIGLLIECALARGARFEQIVAGTGITLDDYHHARIQGDMSLKRILDRNVIRIFPVSDFAHEFGRCMAAQFPLVSTLMTQETLGDVARCLEQYQDILGLPVQGRMEVDADEILIRLQSRDEFEGDPDLVRFNMEFMVFTCLHSLERMTSLRVMPKRLQLPFPHSAHSAAIYGKVIECPVEFDRPGFCLHYDAAILAIRMPGQSDYMSRAFDAIYRREFVSRTRAGVMGEVVRSMVRRVGRLISLEEVAGELKLPSGNLKHRLKLEGKTFTRILNEELVQLAKWYLTQTTLTQSEIAQRMGFSNLSNFRRSILQRTGKSPSELRRRPGVPAA